MASEIKGVDTPVMMLIKSHLDDQGLISTPWIVQRFGMTARHAQMIIRYLRKNKLVYTKDYLKVKSKKGPPTPIYAKWYPNCKEAVRPPAMNSRQYSIRKRIKEKMSNTWCGLLT